MKRIAVVLALLLLAGCGIRRQAVRVDIPSERVNPANGPSIAIRQIVDARQPSTELRMDAQEQSRNLGGIGRGSNGTAVDLEDGTVVDLMRSIITNALRNVGYKVVDAAANTPQVDVKIDKFQVVAPFQFWRTAFYNSRMIADISADVTINTPNGKRSFTATGHGYNVYQRIFPENWKIAMDKAAADFSRDLQSHVAAE